jgi:Asp-tRNA(Asn)/Glu-tRNA(Gln) amidotransferase C subunit
MSSEHAPGRSYIKSAEPAEPITPEITRLVTRLAGVPLPEEDVELLTAALGSQLAAVSVLDELDLTDVNPAVEFDASWT